MESSSVEVFRREMRTMPRIHALVAVPYVRTELQLRFVWCMMGLTREEYDSEERKRSKDEKVFLMTNLRDLIVQEGAAVACAKRRDALCFIRFLIEQISVPALSTCVKMLREGDERTKALFLLALLDMQQSKPMRVNMKEPEELEPMKKIDEIRRFSNKELRLTKESMGALPKSSEYCGPIKKKSYGYVSGIIGIAYNPFLSEDIRDCFFDYEQAVLLRFWTSRTVTIKSVNNPQAKLGLVLEEEVTAPSVPKSDKRVEFGLGFSDELLRTSLMTVWELMRPSWCPSPNADSILRATQDVQRELNADFNLRDLNIIYNVMVTASKSNGEDKVELPGWGPEDWVKPGSCLAKVCGLEGHVCGGLECVKTLEKQHKQLTVLFGNVVMKARTETELIADCHGGTDVNLVTALGFYSMIGSLESLLNLEQKHEMVTAISVEVFPGVLQTEQKYIGKWREAIETEMNIRHSETYCRPSGARYLVGSTLAPMCRSRYPVHFVAVDVKSTRTIVDQAFSVPKCVRLARMSEKSYELLCKIFSAVPERTKEELESIVGKKFMGYVSGNFSDFERQKQRGSTVTDYNAVDENDEVHRVMMEVELLLEASGKRNWRSIMLTHDEFPCHCLLQTWWYPKRSNLMLIWDSGELLSMGLPDSSQPVTIVIVGVMMAIRWLEAHLRENNRQEAPTREQLQKIDCLKDVDLFETMCKVLNIPMEVKKIWARKRLMPWFRANMTAWLYEYDSILRATQDVQRELNADCNLRDLNIIYNVMITASKSNGEDKVELPGWGPEDWVKPGSCLAKVCGLEGHVCGGLECVKTLEKQHKQLTVLFGNVVMKARTETELIADCHGGTDVNLVTALGFYSMIGSLESLLNLEQKHEVVTAISVEVFPGVLQTEQKYIGKWREAIETEMNIRHSETYCRPSGAQYLVGSTLAPMCRSRYPVHFVAVDVKSTRTIVDQAFSVPKCVRLARMSEKSYELLCKMFSAVPERTKEELESIVGKKFMGYVSGNFSDFERQKQRGSTVTDYNAVDENDEVHRVMMEVEPLLEASGKRNWRSIMLTHDEFPCHCLLQTWWYPKRSNLMLIWDSGELLSMGLPDSSQPVTIVMVGVMMAIRWLEAHVRENNRQEAPTREQLQKIDCLKDVDLFETMCKVLNIPMEVKKILARKRLMPWFRANMTAWLYEYDSILRATQDVQRELNADCNLRDLNIIYNVMITASKSNGEDKVELPGWGPEDWVKPGSCLAKVCGLEGHVCGGLECVKTLEKQHKQLTVLFGNVVMKARTETELIADCHGGTDVNLVTALGFYSMIGSLESLLNLEQKHEVVTAISVEVFPGVLQTEQKYIGKWREAIETEMNIRHSETYCRPSGAQYLVGSTLAPMCRSRYVQRSYNGRKRSIASDKRHPGVDG